jgi:serine/threonine protein kinase
MSSTPSSRSNSRGVRVGKYEILSHIATGGMGAVYRALDTELNREVALKVLSPELAAKPNLVERFRREARSAAKLRHRNIVTIFECGESSGGTHYLVMEYIDGVDLGDYLRAKGKLEPNLAWVLMRQATKALAHAYEQGIVHRDIKPSNFILTKKDKKPLLKLTDMGLAREVNEEQYRVTTAGTTVGTVDYMSPEQARDSQAADTRSDMYSLGCAFFHLLTGQPPFEGSLTERILKHLESRPPDICQLNPAVPARMKQILEKLLEKNPRDRYQTPLELLRELSNPPSGLLDGDASQENVPSAEEGLASLEALALEESFADGVASNARSRLEKNENSTEQIQLAKTPSSIKIKKPGSDSLVLPAGSVSAKKPKSDGKVTKPVPAAKPRSDQAAPATPAKPKLQPVELPKKEQSTNWMPFIAIGIGLAVAVFVVFALVRLIGHLSSGSGSSSGANKQNQPSSLFPVPSPGVAGGNKVQANNPQPVPVASAQLLFVPVPPRTPQELRDEFEGPHLKSASLPPAGKTYKVSRSATDEMSFTTLEDALKKTAAESSIVIEIHENGPLLERTVAEMSNRHILIRAGAGYRPLIVWDIPATELVAPPWPDHFLAVNKGSLRLENIHFAVKWEKAVQDNPSVFFAARDSSLTLDGCTISVAGKHSRGFVICQLQSINAPATGQVNRCYFRGDHCTALAVEGAGADVLVRDSLLVNGKSSPLLRGKADLNPATLRLVRSTLVSGNHLLYVLPQRPGEEGNLRCLSCDCLLAHTKGSPDGTLVLVPGGLTGAGNWRPFNCLYAGWSKLLDSLDRKIAGTDLDAWRSHWRYYQGDKVLPVSWPVPVPAKLAECPAAVFQPAKTPAYFAAMSGPGILGCDPQTLSPLEDRWLESSRQGVGPLFPKLPRPTVEPVDATAP